MTLIETPLAALMLGCTDRWVRTLVCRGDLTNRGTPRRIMLDVDQVADLAARRLAERNSSAKVCDSC